MHFAPYWYRCFNNFIFTVYQVMNRLINKLYSIFLLEGCQIIWMELESSKDTKAAPRKVFFYSLPFYSLNMPLRLFKLYFLMICYDLLQMRFVPKAPPRRAPKPEVKSYLSCGWIAFQASMLASSYFDLCQSHFLFAVKWMRISMPTRLRNCYGVSMYIFS